MHLCLNCLTKFNALRNTHAKYCSNKCQQDYIWKEKKKALELRGTFLSIKEARRYLIEKYGNVCFSCKTFTWLGKPIPLVCDHINGNSEDFAVSNIRMICPNCDALTPTYKGKNKGNGRFSRMQRYYAGLSS